MVPVAGSPTVTVWWDESFSSAAQSGGLTGVPTATVLPYALATAPGGFLLCDGTIYNITAYPTLGGLLLATYGGNGTTTFAVPDLRRRFPIGTGTGVVLGKNEGQAIDSNRNAIHNHTATNVNHTGTTNTSTGGTGTRVNTIAGNNDGQHTHGIGNSPTLDYIPHLAINYIVKT
jgi:microcystin-dependent protein